MKDALDILFLNRVQLLVNKSGYRHTSLLIFEFKFKFKGDEEAITKLKATIV